jgi:hypothetical protein
MTFLILIIVIGLIVFGYKNPIKASWLILFWVPLLGPGGFYFGVNTIFPLNAYRLGIFLLIGILVRKKASISNLIYRNKYTHIILAYFFIIFVLQVRHYPVPTLFTLLPFYAIAVLLPFVLLREYNDIYKMINVFVYQAVIISSFVIIEYYTTFSLPAFIRELSGLSIDNIQTKGGRELYRAGYYRVAGLHGNSVQTAYHLVFLFPLAVLSLYLKVSVKGLMILILIIFSIILLQTRASLVALTIVTLLCVVYIVFNQKYHLSVIKKIKIFSVMSILVIVAMLNNELYEMSRSIISTLYYSVFSDKGGGNSADLSILLKIDRIPLALRMFYNSPIYGHLASPRYAYYVLMKTADVPSVFLHLLGGGILLTGIYLLMIVRTITGLSQGMKKQITHMERNIIVFSSIAIFGGFIVTASNWAEEHYLSIFILYISVKYYTQNIKKLEDGTERI